MGLNYSYQIFVPARNARRALEAVAELGPEHRRTPVPPLPLTLPDGDRLTVPFTSRGKSEPVDCTARNELTLDASLMFGLDDAVRSYMGGREYDVDDLGRVQIGYIYVMIEFASSHDPRFASLDFMAATSDMSRLFERSASIRSAFLDLVAAIGGACCVFDAERADGVYEVCWLNGTAVRETVPGPRFADWDELVATWSPQAA